MRKTLWAVPVFALFLQGCGVTMTRYETNDENVQLLQQQKPLQEVNKPLVTAAAGLESLSVRANPIKSPSGSIVLHIQDAITEELNRTGLIDLQASRHLDVAITKNELTAGSSEGSGVLAARFTVTNNGMALYAATKEVQSKWPSSFVGAVAVPNAANAYNPLIRDLLKALYSDPLFINSLK